MTASVLVTPPTTEPVSLSELKNHARIDTTDDDALLTALIVAARQWAERFTQRVFITQTWRLWLDTPPETATLNLPRSPLISVLNVQFYDDADGATVWSNANYFVDTSSENGRLALRNGATWPSAGRNPNGMMIEYTAGYGGAAAVPESIKLAIKQLATHWYEHRGEAIDVDLKQAPLVIEMLLSPYKIRKLS